jgi:hypothetical protein
MRSKAWLATMDELESASNAEEREAASQQRRRMAAALDGDDAERIAREGRILHTRGTPTDRDRAIEALAQDAYHAALFEQLRARGVAPFSEVPNPWTPIFEIAALGYGLHAITRDAVLLYAP